MRLQYPDERCAAIRQEPVETVSGRSTTAYRLGYALPSVPIHEIHG